MTKLGELKLGELLDTPPPGLDEAIAIAKVYILNHCLICFLSVLDINLGFLMVLILVISRSFNFLSLQSITCLLA